MMAQDITTNQRRDRILLQQLHLALVHSGTARRSIDGRKRGDQLKTITYLKVETFDDDIPALNISIVQIISFDTASPSVGNTFHFGHGVYIAFAKKAIAWTCNINHSAVQGALECSSQDSFAGGFLNSPATNIIRW
jgi:hypothetical protein